MLDELLDELLLLEELLLELLDELLLLKLLLGLLYKLLLETSELELKTDELLPPPPPSLSGDEQEKVNATASKTPATDRKLRFFIYNLLWMLLSPFRRTANLGFLT
jgi:hypothetical protein